MKPTFICIIRVKMKPDMFFYLYATCFLNFGLFICMCNAQNTHYLFLLLKVSYIPAEVFTTPGSEVTVYAVFHNRSWSARKAVWYLNGQKKIPESQYRVINYQVSAVTMKVDEPGFDTLMCCQQLVERVNCSIPYAKIYTEGGL